MGRCPREALTKEEMLKTLKEEKIAIEKEIADLEKTK
jgi:hypothetical protein